MRTGQEKVASLVEALPFIRRSAGKIYVVKCGGAAMTDPEVLQNIMHDIALLHFLGIRLVLVHGAGPEISNLCQRLQMPVEFVNGRRVTDKQTLEVVQMVLVGKTNQGIVSALNQLGVKAVGISGQDAGFIQAKHYSDPVKGSLGFVGEISKVDTSLLTKLLAESYLPVISPLASDQGQTYNINADTAAGEIAGALTAEKLIFLSDINGIYLDPDNDDTRISTITAENLQTLLQDKAISGGMIPKVQACLQTIHQGVSSVHILDGRILHSLLLEIFTQENMGTLITA